MVSSFPLPLIEEPRCGYDKDDKLTGLHQCTLAENLKYSLNFLTKSISRNHQMRMSAKTMSTYPGFEPSITKNMIEVREACPGECKDRKREHLPWGSFYEWWRWVLVLIYPQHEEYRWQLATTPSKTVRCFLPSPIVPSLLAGHSKISLFSSRWHFEVPSDFQSQASNLSAAVIVTVALKGPTQWDTTLVCCIFYSCLCFGILGKYLKNYPDSLSFLVKSRGVTLSFTIS